MNGLWHNCQQVSSCTCTQRPRGRRIRAACNEVCMHHQIFSRFFTSLHFFTLTFSGMQCFLVHFASRLKLSIKRRLPNR